MTKCSLTALMLNLSTRQAEYSPSHSGRCAPRNELPCTHSLEGWVGPSAATLKSRSWNRTTTPWSSSGPQPNHYIDFAILLRLIFKYHLLHKSRTKGKCLKGRHFTHTFNCARSERLSTLRGRKQMA